MKLILVIASMLIINTGRSQNIYKDMVDDTTIALANVRSGDTCCDLMIRTQSRSLINHAKFSLALDTTQGKIPIAVLNVPVGYDSAYYFTKNERHLVVVDTIIIKDKYPNEVQAPFMPLTGAISAHPEVYQFDTPIFDMTESSYFFVFKTKDGNTYQLTVSAKEIKKLSPKMVKTFLRSKKVKYTLQKL